MYALSIYHVLRTVYPNVRYSVGTDQSEKCVTTVPALFAHFSLLLHTAHAGLITYVATLSSAMLTTLQEN